MAFLYYILFFMFIYIIFTFFFHLLLNPYFWIIIGVFVIYSGFKRKSMEKQTQEYYQNFEKETQQKKQSYQSSNTHGDVIDVDYTIVEETED